MESYKNSLHVFVDVIHKKFVSIHLIYGDYSEHFLDGKPTERNPNSGDAVSTSSGHKTEHLPEAICEFNVLEPSSVSAGTQYNYSDFLGKDDHTYAKTWTDNQTTLTQTKIPCTAFFLY
jgi:hypothetical protein